MKLEFCNISLKPIILLSLIPIALSNCVAPDQIPPAASTQAATSFPVNPLDTACPVSEPAWAKPPDDTAIRSTPAYGYYFINRDQSIWASAWWEEAEDYPLRASKDGIKVGWFRPAGETLEITGRRLDGHSPPLETHIPCCYPTRFQSSGLYFPGEGCWEITASAGESVLSFIVRVEP